MSNPFDLPPTGAYGNFSASNVSALSLALQTASPLIVPGIVLVGIIVLALWNKSQQ